MRRKIIEIYQDLGVDEIISEVAIDRYNNKAKKITITEEIKPSEFKEKPSDHVFVQDKNTTPSRMTQDQVISKLAQKHLQNNSKEEINSISDIVKQVEKSILGVKNLEDLEKLVRDFDGCKLKKMATNTVFSDGNPNAKIMIIGEAPGNHEDLQGIPFCGDSGKLLDQMFLAINKNRQNDLYVTNTLFWRPPGNRRPTEDELAVCKPFVEKHIELISPDLIVLMGATAMSAILEINDPISKVRGKFLDYSNNLLSKPIKTISLFHPSYMMRQPGKKRLAWKDLTVIDDFINEFTS